MELWLPGAERLKPSSPGGYPLGKRPARAIWHTTESDAGDRAFEANRAWLVKKGSESTILWDPTTGRKGQFFPADRAARTVKNWGSVRTNRTGRRTIQIEVLGRAAQAPLLNGPCIGLEEILVWLDDLGIPRDWPAGAPLSYPASAGLRNGNRSPVKWLTKGGHFGHSQVPGNTHGDPGLVDLSRFKKKPVAAESVPPVVKPTTPPPVLPQPTPKVFLANVIDAARRDPRRPQGATTHKADVLLVEKALVAEKLLPQMWVDGSFGTITMASYERWQRRLGYTGKDANGIPGRVSLTALGKKHGFKVV